MAFRASLGSRERSIHLLLVFLGVVPNDDRRRYRQIQQSPHQPSLRIRRLDESTLEDPSFIHWCRILYDYGVSLAWSARHQSVESNADPSFIITKWNQTLFAMIGFTIINMAGTIVLITVPPSGSTRVGLFIAFNLMQAFAAVNPAIFLMLSRNSAGSTKKSFTYALTC